MDPMFPSHEFCDASSSYRFCVSQKDKNHISLSYLFPCYGYAFCGGVIKMTPIQRTPMWPLGFKLASKIYISPNAKLFFFNFQLPLPSIFELILLLLYEPTFFNECHRKQQR